MADNLDGVKGAGIGALSPLDKLRARMGDLRNDAFSGDGGIIEGARITAASIEGVGDASGRAAASLRASAPTIANNNAVSNAISNVSNNSVVNNNGQGNTGINIRFDNKKFADLFDVQVEKSIGRAARKAVI